MKIELDRACELIKQGEIVAIPTETVYGLAADAKNAVAVQKIFDTKGRPADNPLIVHISSLTQMKDFSDDIPEDTYRLAEHFWPGPLTLVLKRKADVLDIVTAGLDTVAIRMPDHPLALNLIEQTGPVTAPSANRSGKPSPTKVEHIVQDYGDTLPYLDGGPTNIGIESTVLDISEKPYRLLRPGNISGNEISDLLGVEVKKAERSRRSPGTRHTHYKPNASIHWLKNTDLKKLQPNAFYIFHSIDVENIPQNAIHFRGDYSRFARSLYDLYRTADLEKMDVIYIEPFSNLPNSPILSALFNRIEHSVIQ
ncbi:MAG: L-threonylcarbamoyladenylate synthase [Balneolaceae bacterium]